MVETAGRLSPGTRVDVVMTSGDVSVPALATIVHCTVASLSRTKGLRYRAGLRFGPSSNYPAGSRCPASWEPATRMLSK